MRTNEADNLIRTRMVGLVGTAGRGDARGYVEKAFGMKYGTYSRRLKDPGEITLNTLRQIAKTCSMTDDEILTLFGRKGKR